MLENKPRVINDYIFKKIFSKKGNESVLRDFLIGVLDIPIEKVETKAEVSLEKQIEIAKNMLKKGMDIKLISELTNLSIEEIKKIKC